MRTLLGPLWVTTFRDPVRTGRLRLQGLTSTERLLARCGLVMLAVLLVSVLFADRWRRRDLLPLTITDEPVFVPEGMVPVTLVALFLAVGLVVWGALGSGLPVRLTVALVYLATLSSLSYPPVLDVGGSWWLAHGGTVLEVGYWVPFGGLVLSAVLSLIRRRVVFPIAVATRALRGLTMAALASMVVAHLAMDAAARDAGLPGNVQSLLHSGIKGVEGLLIPLVFITAVAIADFATDVSTSLAEPVRSAPARLLTVLKLLLVAVVLVKLWFVVWRHLDYWTTTIQYQPLTLVRTLVGFGLLTGLAVYVRRAVPVGPDADVDEAKEALTLGGAVIIPAALLVSVFLVGLAQLVLVVSGDTWGLDAANRFPVDFLSDAVPIAASVAAIGVGLRLIRHGSRRLGTHRARELGTVLLFVGAWNLPGWIEAAVGVSWSFSAPAINLAITLAALAWLLLRWRRLDAAETSLLLAVVTFSWLVLSQGDYISYLGGLLGLPAVTVVVFGVVWTLLSGSAFTTDSSRQLPRSSRTLMYLGYLLFSATLLNWQQVIHDLEVASFAQVAFYLLSVPIAAWLLVRRIIPRQLEATGAAVEPTEQAQSVGAS